MTPDRRKGEGQSATGSPRPGRPRPDASSTGLTWGEQVYRALLELDEARRRVREAVDTASPGDLDLAALLSRAIPYPSVIESGVLGGISGKAVHVDALRRGEVSPLELDPSIPVSICLTLGLSWDEFRSLLRDGGGKPVAADSALIRHVNALRLEWETMETERRDSDDAADAAAREANNAEGSE